LALTAKSNRVEVIDDQALPRRADGGPMQDAD
jgi:hypothetical protein